MQILEKEIPIKNVAAADMTHNKSDFRITSCNDSHLHTVGNPGLTGPGGGVHGVSAVHQDRDIQVNTLFHQGILNRVIHEIMVIKLNAYKAEFLETALHLVKSFLLKTRIDKGNTDDLAGISVHSLLDHIIGNPEGFRGTMFIAR